MNALRLIGALCFIAKTVTLVTSLYGFSPIFSVKNQTFFLFTRINIKRQNKIDELKIIKIQRILTLSMEISEVFLLINIACPGILILNINTFLKLSHHKYA